MSNSSKIYRLWKPITFSENWQTCDTSILDDISDSWFKRRTILTENSLEYADFLNRLKREHAIETGVIERLYDLKKGITETFIKEGFVRSYLSHGDTDIPENELMAHLNDHLEAVDFIFDVVKENRPLTAGFIKELYHLVTRSQKHAEGRDQFGHKLKIDLLKGDYKKRENNPTREDGTIIIYCPPEHVASEMDNLVEIYTELITKDEHPLIISAWFHHAFTIIHPFQDGNGRVARLLASLIFIKFGFFPFTVLREEAKVKYIEAYDSVDISIANCSFNNQKKQHYFYRQIVGYAKKHDYFFNRSLPKSWLTYRIELAENKKYQLGLSIHHFGYDDRTLAVGSFLEFKGSKSDERIDTTLPLDIPPHVISIDGDISGKKKNIRSYIEQALALTLAQIASEIN